MLRYCGLFGLLILFTGSAWGGEKRKIIMLWEPASSYQDATGGPGDHLGTCLGSEVTDFVVGFNVKTLAAAESSSSALPRRMMNEMALAAGIRCWVGVDGAETEMADAALKHTLASGAVFDFARRPPTEVTAEFARRAQEVARAGTARRGFKVSWAVRIDAISESDAVRLADVLTSNGADAVIAPSTTLSSFRSVKGSANLRLIADDAPTTHAPADYYDWFERGFDAGFAGFCLTEFRRFPYDKVPFLTYRRLTRAALDEYRDINVIPAPVKMVRGEGTVTCDAVAWTVDPALPKEGYRISVTKNGIAAASADAAGRFYGEQTLGQLRRPDGTCPVVEIEDSPAYPYRGVSMDESRHFFGKDFVKTVIDTMARYKLNVFQWHLTDNEGWRLEIPGFPELTEYGAVRPGSLKYGTQFGIEKGVVRTTKGLDMSTYGPFFYTEADIREIVAYAEERHVTIVPEVDFPSHCTALLAAYPQFACDPSVWSEERWPNCDALAGKDGDEYAASAHKRSARCVICIGNDECVAFIEKALDYVCRIFPSKVISICGDECPTVAWEHCPKCRVRMAANGITDIKDLQPWLSRRLVAFIEARGKRAMGDDEMLVGDVPKSAMGWYWRPERWIGRKGQKEVRTLADWTASGYDLINCDWDYTYFYCAQGLDEDPFMYGSNLALGRRPFGGDCVSLERVYSFDPARGVAPENRRHVLGSACSNWAEYTWNRFDFEWKLWPRGLAFAEVLWSGSARPGYEDFLKRAAVARRNLIRAGVNCAPLAD